MNDGLFLNEQEPYFATVQFETYPKLKALGGGYGAVRDAPSHVSTQISALKLSCHAV